MSIVYKAFDPRIDRYLAIKVLKEDLARDVSCRQRFLREARAAGGLGHPNIVTVFDVGQADGMPYLAMELLEGETLEERLSDQDPLALDEILDLAIQLVGALSYAHERGVIHRDIKPANIHFDVGSGMVKLMDFGIAGISRPGSAARRESVVGTPAYMAPEQLSGSEDIDGRADLYSLGVVLYRLLAGRLPFTANRLTDLVSQIMNEPPQRVQPVQADTPVELVELVQRLLVKRPDGRYSGGSELLEELQEIRAGMDKGLLESARRARAAWRWPLAIGAAVALILAVGLIQIHAGQNRAMTETTYGYGEALATVIARETAEALLLDDSTALANLVTDFTVNPRMTYLHILDRDRLIRASTNPFLQDEPMADLSGRELSSGRGAVRVVELPGGSLEFQAPIQFQTRRVGEVRLGLDKTPLRAAARGTLWMMTLIFLVAMATLALGLAWMIRRQGRLFERIGWGLRRVGRGQYEFRLDSGRIDEFSALYRNFNEMAARLEARHGSQPDGTRGDTEPLLVDRGEPEQTQELESAEPNPGDDKVTPFRDRRRGGD